MSGLGLAAAVLCFASSPAVILNDLEGRAVRPLDSPGTVVLLFTRTDCPISNRYAPEVRRIYEAFSARGVRFWLVYVDPKQPLAAMRQHRTEFAYPFPGLHDPRHELVRLAGAAITPEAAVFVDGRLVYRGRIDDRYVSFGTSRQAASVHDLEQVLASAVAGKRLEFRSTKSVGCFIEDLRP